MLVSFVTEINVCGAAGEELDNKQIVNPALNKDRSLKSEKRARKREECDDMRSSLSQTLRRPVR